MRPRRSSRLVSRRSGPTGSSRRTNIARPSANAYDDKHDARSFTAGTKRARDGNTVKVFDESGDEEEDVSLEQLGLRALHNAKSPYHRIARLRCEQVKLNDNNRHLLFPQRENSIPPDAVLPVSGGLDTPPGTVRVSPHMGSPETSPVALTASDGRRSSRLWLTHARSGSEINEHEVSVTPVVVMVADKDVDRGNRSPDPLQLSPPHGHAQVLQDEGYHHPHTQEGSLDLLGTGDLVTNHGSDGLVPVVRASPSLLDDEEGELCVSDGHPSPPQGRWTSPSQPLLSTVTSAATTISPGSTLVLTTGFPLFPSAALESPAKRTSTQLITRAAATRPTASPGTMWICVDDDDDTAEPTSPSSPILRNVVFNDGTRNSGSPQTRIGGQQSAWTSRGKAGESIASTSPSAASSRRLFTPMSYATRNSLGRCSEWRGVVCSSQSYGAAATHRAPGPVTSLTQSLFNEHNPETQPLPGTSPVRKLVRQPMTAQLSPTFRPRRGALHVGHTPPRRQYTPPPSNAVCAHIDDEEAEVLDGSSRWNEEKPLCENSDLSSRCSATTSTKLDFTLPITHPPSPSNPRVPTPPSTSRVSERKYYGIIDDDENEVEKNEDVAATNHGATITEACQTTSQGKASVPQERGPDDELAPQRSVTEFLFPLRKKAACKHQGTRDGPRNSSTTDKISLATSASIRTPTRAIRGRNSIQMSTTVGQDSPPPVPQRPVDSLKRLFPQRLTRRIFMDTVRDVLTEEHCLDAGVFWSAFSCAEYVGEGSFGLVWRCRTVDGDLVAVKSCPIALCSRAHIADAFSSLREVAMMRFLTEHQVPYVLPLHSAFFVKAREALPPVVQAALEMQRDRRRQAEKAALAKNVCHLTKGRRGRASENGRAMLEQEVQQQLEHLLANETQEERAKRERMAHVRLPRFLSIGQEDVLQCDATMFLVTELCSGDVESIPLNDGMCKGVAYCVSSALAAMHELGLLHLDLKPSNILVAHDPGPSQPPKMLSPASHPCKESNNHSVANARLSVGTGFTAVGEGPITTPDQVSPQSQGSSLQTNFSGAVKFYLTDFGNCHVVGPNADDTVEDVFGTFEYMDLMALQDKVCSRATDCFSLGATLYEMMFGKRVYPKCQNPNCEDDQAHTRHCFVEAAKRPITLVVNNSASGRFSGQGTPGLSSKPSEKGAEGITDRNTPQRVFLTALQRVTAGLLRHNPSERMTVEQCRTHLVKAYNITTAPP